MLNRNARARIATEINRRAALRGDEVQVEDTPDGFRIKGNESDAKGKEYLLMLDKEIEKQMKKDFDKILNKRR
jgi:hypothetical protein